MATTKALPSDVTGDKKNCPARVRRECALVQWTGGWCWRWAMAGREGPKALCCSKFLLSVASSTCHMQNHLLHPYSFLSPSD